MPVHHFMAEDIGGSLLAICVLALFLWTPGYAIGWLFDLFDFRRRSGAFRTALAVPFSIAICPIATFLIGRFGGIPFVCGFYAAMLVVCFDAWSRPDGRPGLPREWRAFAAVGAVWLAIVLFALVDLQFGTRLYYPTNSYDYSLRAALTHAISTTGIPPQTPLFLPAHPVALRYHYFWLMMCSLANQTAPGWISARQAEIGGAFWCGIGVLAMMAAYLRLFLTNAAAPLRKRVLTGIMLMGITGLDILPGLFFLSLYARGLMSFVMPSLEAWNEYVDWFLHSVIWAPHAVAALIAAATGFLLLWHAAGRAKYVLLAGLALASTVGISIWVAFVFGVFFVVWTFTCACKRWTRDVLALAGAGATAFILILPYLRDLSGGTPGGSGGGSPMLQLTVRTFSLAALVPSWHGMAPWTRLVLVNGSLLPVNYLLEFGCFAAIAVIQWRRYRASGKPPSPEGLALGILLATSAIICTFLKSSVIGNNDLGWRGFLPAQFVLLLWAVDIWIDRPALTPRARTALVLFAVLGAAGTAYDLALTRFYPVLADRGVLPPIAWMAPDRQFGERNYAAREAYEWARKSTPETAVLQFDPAIQSQETAAMLYADRRAVASDLSCNIVFGGDPAACKPVVERLEQLYAAPASATIGDICESLPVDLLVAKQTDPVWSDARSWVWTERPVFANPYVRVFGCRPPAVARR